MRVCRCGQSDPAKSRVSECHAFLVHAESLSARAAGKLMQLGSSGPILDSGGTVECAWIPLKPSEEWGVQAHRLSSPMHERPETHFIDGCKSSGVRRRHISLPVSFLQIIQLRTLRKQQL
jgi:hypothetical protein